MTPAVTASGTGSVFQSSESERTHLDQLAGVVDGVALPRIENLNIPNAQTVKVFVTVQDGQSYKTRFLQGAASSAGGTITAIVVLKIAQVFYGMWEGATAGAVAGPEGALVGALVGGAVGFVV